MGVTERAAGLRKRLDDLPRALATYSVTNNGGNHYKTTVAATFVDSADMDEHECRYHDGNGTVEIDQEAIILVPVDRDE